MSGLNDVVKQAQQQIDAIEHALGIPQQTPGEGSPPGQANTAPMGAQGGEGGGATAPQPAQPGQQGQQQPGQPAQQPQQQQSLPFQAQQDQPQPGQLAPQQQTQQQITTEDRKWESMYRTAEQKFQVLQGKYNAEVPRLQHQLRETEQRASTFEAKASTLEQRMVQLEQAMQAGQGGAVQASQTGQGSQGQQGQFNQQGQQGKAGQATQQGASGANGGFPIDLSGVDFETLAATYPDDLAPMIRIMPQMVQHMQSQEGVIANLQQQLAATTEGMRKVVTNVEQVNAERAGNAQRAFHAELGRICPEWQQIDNMPDFHNWLDQRKPMSVRTYRQDAEEAWGAGDAVAVAECYNAFRSDFLSNQGQRQNGQQQGNVQNPGSQQPHNNQQPPDGSWQQGQGQQQGQQNQQQVQQGQQGNSGQQQQIVQQGQQGNPQSQQQTFMQFDEFGQPIYIGPQVNQQVQQGQQFQQGNHGQQQGQNYQQGQPHNPLEYMVEPSPMAGNPPQAPPVKWEYTIQEINDHSTKMTKNPALLRDPTWAAIKRDMDIAVLEGRVKGQLPDMRLQSGEARFVQGV